MISYSLPSLPAVRPISLPDSTVIPINPNHFSFVLSVQKMNICIQTKKETIGSYI